MAHRHHHGTSAKGRRLVLSMAITFVFVIAEAISGYFSHSLALVSDAGHNLADALALFFAWYGVWIARKPSTQRHTFGYHRVGILAALVNAVSLVVIALLIFREATGRLSHPQEVQGAPMIVVAIVAIVMNTAISFWLKGDAEHDLNVRSAYMHMVGDAISAIGVVAAGLMIALTGITAADSLLSILIGFLILWSSWGILQESVNVLLESIPKGMDMGLVEHTIV